MEKNYNNIKSRGLPGGPNEVFSYVTGVFSTDGYRSDSQDVNNPFNVIPSGNITMKERDGRPLKKGPLLGVDNLGNRKIMHPGQDYQFPGSQVTEIPMAQIGGPINKWGFLNSGKEQREYVVGSGLNFPTGTGINAIGVIPKNSNPIFKGVGSFGVTQKLGNDFNIGTKVDIPFLNDNKRNKAFPSLRAEWKKNLGDFNLKANLDFPLKDPSYKGVKGEGSIIYNIPANKKKKTPILFADGGIPKAQAGEETKTYKDVNKLLTYKNNSDWFDSRAVYHDNPTYDNMIREKIYSGDYGYDPSNQSIHPLAPKDRVVVSDEVSNIRAKEKKTIAQRDRVRAMSPEAQEADRIKTITRAHLDAGDVLMPIDEIGSRSNPLLREEDKTGSRRWEGREGQTIWLTKEEEAAYYKDWVAKSLVAMGEHPLFYAPGIIAGGAALPALGEAAFAAAAPYFSAPATVAGTTIPGATIGNALISGFAGHGLTHVGPDAVEFAKNPSWINAGNLGMDVLEIAPVVGSAARGTVEGYNAAKQVANKLGNKYLPNAHKLNPNAFKPNPESYYRGIGKEGAEDALQSGVFRPNQSVEPNIVTGFDLSKDFNKTQAGTYYTPNFKIANKYGKGYIAEVPSNAANFTRRYKGKDWSQLTQDQIPITQGRILKQDWLKGYKQIEVPKQLQLPGSPNATKGLFPEIPAQSLNYAGSSGRQNVKNLQKLSRLNKDRSILDWNKMSDNEKQIVSNLGELPSKRVIWDDMSDAVLAAIKEEQKIKFQEGLDIAERWAIKDPEGLKLALKKMDELKNKTGDPDWAKINKIWSGLDDFMDPTFKMKVENIFDASGNPIPRFNYANLNIQDRSKLVYMDDYWSELSQTPSFKNLSAKDQAYLMENYADIGGVRTGEASITLGNKPSSNKFISTKIPKTEILKTYIDRPKPTLLKPESWFNTFKGPIVKETTVSPPRDWTSAEIIEVVNTNFTNPTRVQGVAAHETKHDMQKYKNWIKELQEYNVKYKYYTGTDKNKIAQTYKDAMVEPTLPVDGKFTNDSWLSSVGELDAELMRARTLLISKEIKEGRSLDEAVEYLKALEAKGDDATYSWYLNQGKLNEHFKPSTTETVKKHLLKGLPVITAGFFAAGSDDAEMKNGGSIDFKMSKMQTGGASPEIKAWMRNYKFTDADFDFLNNDESYCPNGGCLKQAQGGIETKGEKPANESYLGDLFVSDADLEKLNSTPDLDINQLPEELWDKQVGRGDSKTYKQMADDNNGIIPWRYLDTEERPLANPYYCTTKGGCLASSYNAYDAVVGQKYPSNEFLSEAKLKKSLGLQSLPSEEYGDAGYQYDSENDSFLKDGEPVSERTDKWIRSIPYFKNTRKGETNFDFTPDSWDTHGVMVEKGGKNIFTSSDANIKNETNKFANLSKAEKQKLYSQMTPGTVVSFTRPQDAKRGDLRIGLNDKYSLGNSSHSAQVVGYAEDGVPIIFDYGTYRRLDSEGVTYGDMNTLSNITIPKEHIGKNLEWAKKNGYFNKEGPGELDLDLTSLYEDEDANIDELNPFYNALKTNKRSLMDDLNIKPKDYDMIAKTLIGITMEETEGGSGLQHSIENEMFSIGQDSVGLTQLMWTNIEKDPKLKKVAAKYGITKKSDLKDSEKSAIASMIYGHRNFLSAKKNYEKGKGKPGIRTYKASDSWKTDVKQYAGKKSCV